MNRQVPRAPLPGTSVTGARVMSLQPPRRALPLRPRSYGLMRQTTFLLQPFGLPPLIPTVSPLLTPIASHNLLLLPSLPTRITYRQGNVRRRKDDTYVGTVTRRIVERLSRVPRLLPSDARS